MAILKGHFYIRTVKMTHEKQTAAVCLSPQISSVFQVSVVLFLLSMWSLPQVGLPAKSGVSGGILLVVPNVMGIMCWSPPLDKLGNSVRGIQFCTVRHETEVLKLQ